MTQSFTHLRDTILRGGRMTKLKGAAASVAPMVGAVVLAGIAGQAQAANECGAYVGPNGVVTCDTTTYTTGPADNIQYVFTGGTLNIEDSALVLDTSGVAVQVLGATADPTNPIAIIGADVGSITTSGTSAHGIHAFATSTANIGAATVTLEGGIVNTSGGRALGVFAQHFGFGAAEATMSGGEIITSGASARALVATNTNAANEAVTTAAMNGGGITTLGSSGYGIFAQNGSEGTGSATAILNAGVVSTSGNNAYAVRSFIGSSSNTGTATVSMSGGSIMTSGTHGYGLFADHDGLGDAIAVMSGGSINTTGISGVGIISSNETGINTGAAVAMMSGGTINTMDRSSYGIYALNAGGGTATAELSDGEISTGGNSSFGIYAFNSNSTNTAATSALMTGGAIDTTGISAHGVYSTNQSVSTGSAMAELSGGEITTAGTAARGVYAHINNSTSTATTTALMSGGTIDTTGAGAHGLSAGHNGIGQAIAIADGTAVITAAGDGSDGIRTTIVQADATYGVEVSGTASVTGGTGAGAGIHTASVVGSSGQIIVGADATVDGSASSIAIRDAAGDTEVTTAGTVTGDAILGLGDDVFNLVGGTYTGDVYGDDVVATAADGDDAFNWTGGVFGSSFFGGNGSDTATITAATYDGTYHVLDGGDDYAAADGWVDELTLGGDASGDVNGANILNWERITVVATDISVIDGALEVGADAGNGLFLNGGTLDQGGIGLALTGNLTNAGMITTQDGAVGDMITVSGDYAGTGMLLVDVDTSTDMADTLTVDGDATGTTGIMVNNLSPLDATGNDIIVATVAGASSATDFVLAGGPLVAGAFQYDLEYQTGDFALVSSLSSTGTVYEAAPFALLDGFTTMPTLEQRVGQRRWNSAGGNEGPASGEWLRVYGDWASSELASGTSYDSDSWGLQVGFDLPVERGDTGQWVLGMTAQTGQSSTAITTENGTGSISAQSLGFGGTATWYGDDDLYVDLQGQVNWISADYSSSLDGELAEGELSRAATASAEIGKRFALNENAGLTPQAQLTWSQLEGATFTDTAGNAVDLGTAERLTGRLGLAYDHEWQGENGSSNNVYAIANILHDFDGTSTVQVAGADVDAERDATWAEIGLGGTIAWDEGSTSLNTELYGEASYRQALDNSDSNALAATAGIRIQW